MNRKRTYDYSLFGLCPKAFLCFLFAVSALLARAEDHWTADRGEYDNYMTVTSYVSINGVALEGGHIEAACFVGGSCRGTCYLTPSPREGYPFMTFLPVWGSPEENGQPVTFKVYDHTSGLEYEADRTLPYEYNGTIGLETPYRINIFQAVYGIDLLPAGDVDFPDATEGYSPQSPHTVTVANTGNSATGALSVTLTGDNPEAFTLSAASLDNIPADGSGSFTVVPKTGLGKGEYAAVVSVSGQQVEAVSFQIRFSVHRTVNLKEADSEDTQMKAWVAGSVLYIEGLEPGGFWRVYNAQGILTGQGIAEKGKVEFPLTSRGLYIIRANRQTGKAVY